ncbi:MAG: MerR family DNA-binding transcriptional regulator, partial [Actinomycetota bacterium]
MLIGELAARTRVPPKTIRYYEEVDLMTPPARTPSGYRDYDEPAVERLK